MNRPVSVSKAEKSMATPMAQKITNTPHDKDAACSRRIVLFPGAFQPPHLAHDTAVRNLAARPDVDEVVVIVTNRHRPIPGTSQALGPDVAQRVWSIYLQGVPKARVEMASGSAVKHALTYFDRVSKADRLVFCVGQNDLGDNGGRFEKVHRLSEQTGIEADVTVAPTAPLAGRATRVRANLAHGDNGRCEFMEALPIHLTRQQREEVWEICRKGMRDMTGQRKNRLYTIIAQSGLGEIEELSSTMAGKPDEVFRLRLKDGRTLYVKYAFDTVKSANLDQPGSLKPRKRLWAERTAIKWLRSHNSNEVEIPEVVYFDKETRTLVLSEVCPGSRKLEDDLRDGVFAPTVARRAGRFLAGCHASTKPVRPLWGNRLADLKHWEMMLGLRTVALQSDDIPSQARRDLETLKQLSLQATQTYFVNLDYCPQNILLHESKLGVIDFELSSSIGDPAYDIGGFLGQYIIWGIVTSSQDICQEVSREALDAYRRFVGKKWWSMRRRTLAFAGATIFHNIMDDRKLKAHTPVDRFIATASGLLSKGLDPTQDPDKVLYNTAVYR